MGTALESTTAPEAEPPMFLDAHRGPQAIRLISMHRAVRLMNARPIACAQALASMPCRGTSLPRMDAAGAMVAIVRRGMFPLYYYDPAARDWMRLKSPDEAIVITDDGTLVGVAVSKDRPNIAASLAVPAAPFVSGGVLDALEHEAAESARTRAAREMATQTNSGAAMLAWQAEQQRKIQEEADKRAAAERTRGDARAHRQRQIEEELRAADQRQGEG